MILKKRISGNRTPLNCCITCMLVSHIMLRGVVLGLMNFRFPMACETGWSYFTTSI